MAFDDTLIFPENVSFGGHGGPAFMTEIVKTGGGLEYVNQPNSQQLCKFDVGHAGRRQDLFIILAKFYWVAKGRFNRFRFKDWQDYRSSDNSGSGIFTQLTATTFQCYKRYSAGATTYDRKITKLYSTFASTGGVFSAVDKNTGIVTMTSGTPTAWTSNFHVPCRFDIDEAQFEIINRNVRGFILGWQSIPIQEVRV